MTDDLAPGQVFAHCRADVGTQRSLVWVLADLSARRWSRPHARGGV